MKLFSILTVSLLSGIKCLLLDELVTEVFRGYEPAVRPQCTATGATNVTMEMALRQLVDLDEPLQILNTIVWIRLSWSDCRLAWNSSQFEGLQEVVVPQNKVWVPDITLYDNADKNQFMLGNLNLLIKDDGLVRFNFPSFIKSLCAVDTTHFPFDYQACKLTFGSWVYSGEKINITSNSNSADMTSYVQNTEWRITDVPVIRLDTSYGVEVYPTVTYVVKLKRRPLFYVLNLLFPCFLISSVAIMGFLLPPASGEKVNLEITVMLSLAVFQLIVLEMMPPTGDRVPFIALYFTISMVLVGLSCLATVVVLNVHFKGTDAIPIPPWVKRYIYRPLAKLTRVKLNQHKDWSSYNVTARRLSLVQMSSNSSSHNGYQTDHVRNGIGHHVKPTNGIIAEIPSPHPIENGGHIETQFMSTDSQARNRSNGKYDTSQRQDMLVMIHRVNNTLESINKHVQETQENGTQSGANWRLFALILDRLFMGLYILSLLIGALSMSFKYIITTDTPDLWSSENIV